MSARRRTMTLAALSLALGTCSPMPSPVVSPVAVVESPPAIDVTCMPDGAAPAYLGDPCPGATVAVELAVAPVRLPIVRAVILPGPFFCDVVWPGASNAPPCYGPMVQPGQFMHAWVAFTGSTKVAAVMLGRDLPPEVGSPAPPPPPWTTTLVTVEVPPAGWAIP